MREARRKIFIHAVAAFFASVTMCGVLLGIFITNKERSDQLLMEQVIMEKTAKLTEVIHKLLYKTEALAALVIQNNGTVGNFTRVAATLLDDPAIANVLLAPDGLVSHVYPLRGNEVVIGFDFFREGAGNEEALLAKDTGQLVFGGPFSVRQGGQALVGRLPVYIHTTDDEKRFWGLVSVTLKYPQVLDVLGLALLEKQGYAFEIWRVNPDTGEGQIIAHSSYVYNKGARFIEKKMEILNATWHFRLSPVKMWHQFPETWILIFVSLFVSLLVAFVVQNNQDLKHMQTLLAEMARIDSLTGIANRRHFMDMAAAYLRRAARDGQSCFVIMFDVDHFKKINDTYGHQAGDRVLRALADRVKREIRPYDLFARYGGEEFILFAAGLDREAAEHLASRIRLSFCESPVLFKDMSIAVSASFGLAEVPPEVSLETAIARADEALYAAKNAGRNRSVCYGAV